MNDVEKVISNHPEKYLLILGINECVQVADIFVKIIDLNVLTSGNVFHTVLMSFTGQQMF